MDAELCRIEIEHGVAVAEFFAKRVVAADGVDLLAGVFCHIGDLMEHFAAAQCQIAAGDVQTGHEQIAARGRLGEVDDLPHITGVDIGADEQ